MTVHHNEKDTHGAKRGILSISIKDLSVLRAAFMPFIDNGGLFIPTTRDYEIGDEVFIFLTLADETEKIPVTGNVVWITPKQPQGNRTPGIGIRFREKEAGSRKKIEHYLAGKLDSTQPTHTL